MKYKCPGIDLCGDCSVSCVTYKLIIGRKGDGNIYRPRNFHQRMAGLLSYVDEKRRLVWSECIMPVAMKDGTRAVRLSSKLEKGEPDIYAQCMRIAEEEELTIIDCPPEYWP